MVGPTDDRHEQEAQRIANYVMRMPAPDATTLGDGSSRTAEENHRPPQSAPHMQAAASDSERHG